jgi:hypothetical protein
MRSLAFSCEQLTKGSCADKLPFSIRIVVEVATSKLPPQRIVRTG